MPPVPRKAEDLKKNLVIVSDQIPKSRYCAICLGNSRYYSPKTQNVNQWGLGETNWVSDSKLYSFPSLFFHGKDLDGIPK